jgi:hypothetical protein
MTNTNWTRGMYRKLENYISLKTDLETIAFKLEVSKGDLPYRIKKVNEGKDYLTLWDEEFHLLNENTNADTFLTQFRGLYGKHRKIECGIYHWNHRDGYLKKWRAEKKPVHNVLPPKTQIIAPITPQKPDAINDERDWNRKIFDALQELIIIQKDTYTLFKTIDDRAVAKAEKIKGNNTGATG